MSEEEKEEVCKLVGTTLREWALVEQVSQDPDPLKSSQVAFKDPRSV